MLYRDGALPGTRAALILDFGGAPLADGPLQGYCGLWLAERQDHVIGCYGCQRPPADQSVGGRVIHDLPVLDSTDTWVEQLAAAIASAQASKIV